MNNIDERRKIIFKKIIKIMKQMDRDLLRLLLLKVSFEKLYSVSEPFSIAREILNDPFFWRQKILLEFPNYANNLPPIKDTDTIDYMEIYKINKNVPHDSNGMDWCAKNNNDILFELLFKKGIRPTQIGYEWLVENGNVKCLSILNNSYVMSGKLISRAVKNGHYQVVEFFINTGQSIYLYSNEIVNIAFIYNKIDILDLMIQSDRYPDIRRIFEAIENGATDTIKYLLINFKDKLYNYRGSDANICPFGLFSFEDKQKIVNLCSLHGNDELLEFFKIFNIEPNNIRTLIVNNRLDYLPINIKGNKNKIRLFINEETFNTAAINGHVNILKLKPHFTFNLSTIQKIIDEPEKYGDTLKVLKYIYNQNNQTFEKKKLNCYKCIQHGKLNVLKFLVSTLDVKLDALCLNNAVLFKRNDIINYLITKIDEYPEMVNVYILNLCCKDGNLFLLKRLVKVSRIYPDKEGLISAARFNRINILKYLYSSFNVMKLLINNKDVEICGHQTLLWLRDNNDNTPSMKRMIEKRIKDGDALNEYVPFEL
jgi:hypothetical protein